MGQIVVTSGAVMTLEAIRRHPVQLLARHVVGDWGDLTEHDVNVNEQALEYGERLFSRYEIEDSRFYVITERDRAVTTVLLPEDY